LIAWQSWHIFDEGNQRSMTARCLRFQIDLYSSYRYVGPSGELREYGRRVLGS
jgi:hypothetical protein